MVFDMEEKKIGIAPARSKYNENLLYLMKEEASNLVTEVEVDIEFMVRYVKFGL